MAHPISQLPSQEAGRVEDYLNDKFQTISDLDNLDTLLDNLREQHELQQKQLEEAQEALAKATKASNDHSDAVKAQIEAFNKQQEDIDRRLMIVTQSSTSDQAVRIFESSMEKLRRLDVAKGYVELLTEIETLAKQVSSNTKPSPRSALESYTRLREIVSSLKDAQLPADGAAPHLVDHAESLASSLREEMRKEYTGRLQRNLEKMKWPGRELVLTDNILAEWKDAVELLLELQKPELPRRDSPSSKKRRDPAVLLPLEVMVHPLELRFKYHFNGVKPTNRLDKPEYFLSHVIDLINNHSGFFASNLQPILDKEAETVDPEVSWNLISATNSYITALLPMLRQKLNAFLPQVSPTPQLLSHLIHELMNFDAELRDNQNYVPDPYSSEDWKGVTWEVLTEHGWFDRWLQVEKDFALARYKDIIDSPDSGQIDYDGVEPSATKPTSAAIRVNDLLETITDRYRPLTSFSQKLRFLLDIQITIFDYFHERLHSGLEAYLAMTSAIGRTVHRSDPQTNLEGVSGLERLCRIFGSAEYLEKKMQDWSDDVFFLELWSELQDRVRRNTDGGANLAGPMSVSDVASRTSQAVTDSSEGALFDETASAYRRLRLRSENIIISTLTSEVQSALKAYSRVSTWASLSSASAASNYPHPPSSDLTPAIRTLSSSISFLAQVLGVAPLTRINRQVLLATQTYIWDNVLMRHTFSAAGASQLASDVEHICSVTDTALDHKSPGKFHGESKRVIRKLMEGLTLLCLRIKPQQAADGGENAGTDTEPRGPSEKEIGLWEAERRLFANNESARLLLAELEFENLTEAEARAVLEKRVEIRS